MNKKNTVYPPVTVIEVCVGLHCAMRGSYFLLNALKEYYKLDIGVVSKDGMLLKEVECMRDCENAIPVIINGNVYHKTSFKSIIKYIDALHLRRP